MGARLLAVGALIAAFVLPGSVAQAAAPSNDTIGGATVIGSIPYSTTEDTTGATTDAVDTQANTDCGAPATDASVWFKHTATSDTDLVADVSGSDYSAGVLIATGTPGNLSLESCGPGFAPFHETNGTTYYILAFDDQGDEGGNGGQLAFTLDVPPPAPEISALTVDPVGHFTRQGSAFISGTVTCTAEAVEFSELDVTLRQTVGRVGIEGFGSGELVCDGASHAWSVEVVPFSGRFAGGRARADVDAFVCNVTDCADSFIGNQPIRLRK
jgi:hypothetical protein